MEEIYSNQNRELNINYTNAKHNPIHLTVVIQVSNTNMEVIRKGGAQLVLPMLEGKVISSFITHIQPDSEVQISISGIILPGHSYSVVPMSENNVEYSIMQWVEVEN